MIENVRTDFALNTRKKKKQNKTLKDCMILEKSLIHYTLQPIVVV